MGHLEVGAEVETTGTPFERLQQFKFVRKHSSFSPADKVQENLSKETANTGFNLNTSELPYYNELQRLYPDSSAALDILYSGTETLDMTSSQNWVNKVLDRKGTKSNNRHFGH